MQKVSLQYYVEQAEKELQDPSDEQKYTLMCLEALRTKAMQSKSLQIVYEEMKKVYQERNTYQKAYEQSTPRFMDETISRIRGPMVKKGDTWFFTKNQMIVDALSKYRLTLHTLPDCFPPTDKEQVAQYCGLSFQEYCALPFVRTLTKKNLYKDLAKAERDEVYSLETHVYQHYNVYKEETEKLRYCPNRLLQYLFPEPSYMGDPTEMEQIRQMTGGWVIDLS